ncbi:MAG: outer membrane protein transport protein [Methylococcaceae bacterium]
MRYNRIFLALGVTSLVLVAGNSYATNGYAMHGIGTKSKGMAGSGSALAQDALVMGINPSAIVQSGNRVDLGAALFSPLREYSVSGAPSGQPGTIPLATRTTESDSNIFLIPNAAYVKQIDEHSSWGIAAFGNGGMNTDYPDFENTNFCPPPPNSSATGPFCGGTAGINLSQLFITPTYARKISGINASWGVSLVGVVQSFEAEGIGAFGQQSSNGAKLSNNGVDYSTGLGVRLSATAELTHGLSAAASVQPKIQMSEFSDYKGLFANGGNFDIPENWNLGIAWNTSDRSTLTFDVQYIKFSGVDSVGNSITQLTSNGNLFGSDNGPGFGWENMTVYKLGYQWNKMNLPEWTWRLGVSHANQPVPDEEVTLNILAPAVVTTHLSAGFTKAMGQSNELSLAFTHALSESVKGSNAFDNTQQVEIEMKQLEVELTYAWKF